MMQARIQSSIGLFVLLLLGACASQETEEQAAGATPNCRPNETLTCDEFAGETYNCSCERGDNLRDMVDAHRLPDY